MPHGGQDEESRFSESQVIRILKKADGGRKVACGERFRPHPYGRIDADHGWHRSLSAHSRLWNSHKRDIPIIALTAYAMGGDKEKFLAAGMSGYVAKPVSMECLMQIMAETLAEQRR